MFNLDHAIVEWCRQLAAAGISSPAVLDELENHLRDDIASQLEAGANAQQAFDAAVGRIGNPTTLRSEFTKSAPKSRPRKLIRALCFTTAIAVLLINTWTLQQFDLSIF